VNKLYRAGQIDNANTYQKDIAECLLAEITAGNQDPFWQISSKDLCCGLAQILRDVVGKEAFTIENILLLLNLGNINELSSHLDPYSIALTNLIGTTGAPSETRASVLSVLRGALSLYAEEGLADMMCRSDFEFQDIGKEMTAVFLKPRDERSIDNPIITTFIKLCYGALIDTAQSEEYKGSLPVRVNFIIDEFSSLPAIPDFSNMISAARSRNIRFMLMVQNLGQLYKTYSQDVTETILSNCGLLYILRSRDVRLHALIRSMCGTYVDEYTHTEWPLIDSMAIQQLDPERGEVFIIPPGQNPYKTELPDIDQYSFNLPAVKIAERKLRAPMERSKIDIQEIRERVKEQEVQRIKEKMRQTELSGTSIQQQRRPLQPGTPEADYFVELYNRRIRELEERTKVAQEEEWEEDDEWEEEWEVATGDVDDEGEDGDAADDDSEDVEGNDEITTGGKK